MGLEGRPFLALLGVARCIRIAMLNILVDIEADISLFGFVELKQKIEKVLGRKVDLVEYNTLKPLLRELILKEQVVLL
jgi:predicted nucleotidyltransferase